MRCERWHRDTTVIVRETDEVTSQPDDVALLTFFRAIADSERIVAELVRERPRSFWDASRDLRLSDLVDLHIERVIQRHGVGNCILRAAAAGS
jgi:hypothetical protein